MKIIIGLTGPQEAGVHEVMDYLSKRHRFHAQRARPYLEDIAEQKKISPTREKLALLANELRLANGPGFIAEQLCHRAYEYELVVIGSLKVPEEIKVLKSKMRPVAIWGFDRDRRKRYEKAYQKMKPSELISWEEFSKREDHEMFSRRKPHEQNVSACMGKAKVFVNNGTLAELYHEVDEAVEEVLVKAQLHSVSTHR